jgi:hypothetical protein
VLRLPSVFVKANPFVQNAAVIQNPCVISPYRSILFQITKDAKRTKKSLLVFCISPVFRVFRVFRGEK